MTLRKSFLLAIGLGMIAALVACSSSSHTTPPPTIAITATSGGGQSQVVGMAFANPLVATVTSNGTASGTPSVTFTAPAGTDGTFASTGTNTETDTAVAGVATSSVFTAGTAAGTYTVTATTSGATTPASFSLTNTSGPAADLAISSGNNQSVAVNGTYASLVAQVTDSDGNPVSGVAMTFTVTAGATGASGSFTSTSSGTESVNTDANGNATVSDLVPNSTTGAFTVTAAPTTATLTPTSVTFNETNVVAAVAPLAAGNYVFFVNGTNVNGAYSWTGVFTVTTAAGVSTITTGEQDYSDFGEASFISAEPITGGTVTAVGGGDTNLVITVNFTDSYINGGAGSLTLDAAMESTTNGQLIEYDNWGSGSGELRQQSSTAAPSAGYSFYLTGFDDSVNGFPVVVGGVLNASSATGSGSVFDANDDGTLSSDQLFSATTFTGPDTMGLVTFTLNPTAGGTITVDGYIVDSTRIYLIENWGDGFAGTAGVARSQGANTGTFSSSSISGSTYVILTEGNDVNGALDVAGMLTFNSNGTVSGNLSFNDLAATNPAQGGAAITGGTYTIDAPGTGNDGGTGRVTVTGLTDGATFTYNLQLYLDGNGHLSVISMDANDGVAGQSQQQASATFTADNFTGPYSIYLTGFNTSELVSGGGSGTFFGEEDMAGVLTATPSSSSAGTLSGYFDSNNVQVGGGLTPDGSATASYATTSTNGVFTVTPPAGLFTFYMVQTAGSGVVFENDNTGLAMGIAAPVQ